MKRFATLMVTLMLGLAASAAPIRYFTQSQATRTVRHLNAQQEIMIYCGYDYEIETYVLVNEVWAERVNSAYYEIWLYGYDAYTGEEVYMPLDLQCVWLFSAGRMYSAAQFLRFHTSVRMPGITWYIPPYNSYVRVRHVAGYRPTYHYDIHCYGWTPQHYGAYHHGYRLPPYYNRRPGMPAPRPVEVWTPGTNVPQIVSPSGGGRTPANGGNMSVPTATSTVRGTIPAQSNSGAATAGGRRGSQQTSTNSGTPRPSTSTTTGTTTTTPSRGSIPARNTTSSTTTTSGTPATQGSSRGTVRAGSSSTGTTTTTTTPATSGSSRGTVRTGSTRGTSSSTSTSSSTTGTSSRGSVRSSSTSSKPSTSGTTSRGTVSAGGRSASSASTSSASKSSSTPSTATSRRGTVKSR